MFSFFKKLLLGNKRISLVYGHVASNFGDVAITEGAIEFLKKFIPEKNIHILIQTPNKIGQEALDELLKRHPDVSLSIWNPAPLREKFAIREFNADQMIEETLSSTILTDTGLDKSDVVLFNSGEHLFSYGDKEQDLGLFIRLAPLFAAHRAKKQVLSFPSTFGPYESDFSKTIFERFAKICQQISVREMNSRTFLAKALNKDTSSIDAHLDPAFYLFNGLNRSKWNRSKKLISISVRLDNFGMRLGTSHSKASSTEFRENNFATSTSFQVYSKLIAYLLKNSDYNIQMVIQTLADKKLTKALYKNAIETLGNEMKSRILIRTPASLFGYIRCLYEGKIVITSRFHALIFGYAMGVPGVGIYFKEHGHKMPGLMSIFKQEQNCFLSSDITPEEIGKIALGLIENDEREGSKILSIIGQMEKDYVQIFKKSLSKPADLR